MDSVIVLDGKTIAVGPLTFGQLRRILPRVRAAIEWCNLRLTDFPAFLEGAGVGLGAAIEVIAAATGKPVSEIEAIPAGYLEAVAAVYVIADLSCLLKKDDEPGEAGAAT